MRDEPRERKRKTRQAHYRRQSERCERPTEEERRIEKDRILDEEEAEELEEQDNYP